MVWQYFFTIFALANTNIMKRFLAIIALIIGSIATITAADLSGTGTLTEHKFSHKGVEYTYWLYIPQNIKPNAPLVMVLHGYGSRDLPVVKYGFNPVADEHGFAVCYPHGPKDDYGKNYWSIGYKYHIQTKQMRDDAGFLVRLVKHLQKSHGFSKENVFSAGNSNGGAMGYILAYTKPQHFAAIASVSGHIMEYMYRRLEPKQPIPILEIHGTHDPLARWNGDPFNNDLRGGDIAIPRVVGLWAATNRCNYEVTEELPLVRNKIIAHKYMGGTAGTQVWLYEIVNGKHSWAENDMNTAAEIWKFFSMYLR